MRRLVQKKFFSKEIPQNSAQFGIRLFLISSFVFSCGELIASQWGPVFPTHDFPTDKSFYWNTNLEYGSQNAAYNDKAEKITLPSSLTRLRFTLNPQYQPNRQLSLGAFINIDSLRLSGDGKTGSKSGISDQYVFGEYRFTDEPGYSVGFATVFKIPLYSTPKDAPSSATLFLGDGQIDAAFLLTSEFWFHNNYKVFGDMGLNYRTDDHASEIPLNIGFAYVSPKWSVETRISGNLSVGNDKAAKDPVSQQIQVQSGGTNYVFAENPQLLKFDLKGEYAFSYQWAVNVKYETTLWGTNSPAFNSFGVGLSYRGFSPRTRRNSYKDVDIETDDSSNEFDGEVQEKIEDEVFQE